MQISQLLDDKNLEAWAALLQARIRYLPFDTHPALKMARRLSHVDTWYVAVTPPGSVIYMVFNIYLHLVYIGVTTSALVSRLRKHITDATSH